MSPGVRMKSGRLKNHLPAVRLGRHFPQAGNRFFQRLYVSSLFQHIVCLSGRRQPQKIVVSCFSTKCGPCRTARKQFSKGCEADRGAAAPKKNPNQNSPGFSPTCPVFPPSPRHNLRNAPWQSGGEYGILEGDGLIPTEGRGQRIFPAIWRIQHGKNDRADIADHNAAPV